MSPTRSSLRRCAGSFFSALLLQLLARRGQLLLALPVRGALRALESFEAVAFLLLLAAPPPALRVRLEGHVAHDHGQQQQYEYADADDDHTGCLHADAHRAGVDGLSGAEAIVLEVEGVVDAHRGGFCGEGLRCLSGWGKGTFGPRVSVCGGVWSFKWDRNGFDE